MKYYLSALFISICFLGFSQETTVADSTESKRNNSDSLGVMPKIDPLRFVQVKEHRRSKEEAFVIWDDSRRFYSGYIDSESEVIISFKLDSLVEKIDFEGNMSLSAKIDGTSIEIPHYAEVGQDFTAVGTTSASPRNFSLSLLTAIFDVYETTNSTRYQIINQVVEESRISSIFNDARAFDLLKENLKITYR